MSKTFTQAPRPKTQISNEDIDSFVQGGAGHDTKSPQLKGPDKKDKPKLKRLSIDLDENLHRRFKSTCARNGLKMALELIEFIELRTSELERKAEKESQSL